MASAAPATTEKDKSKVHKLSLKGSAKLVAEFVSPSLEPHHHSEPVNQLTPSPSIAVPILNPHHPVYTPPSPSRPPTDGPP